MRWITVQRRQSKENMKHETWPVSTDRAWDKKWKPVYDGANTSRRTLVWRMALHRTSQAACKGRQPLVSDWPDNSMCERSQPAVRTLTPSSHTIQVKHFKSWLTGVCVVTWCCHVIHTSFIFYCVCCCCLFSWFWALWNNAPTGELSQMIINKRVIFLPSSNLLYNKLRISIRDFRI